MLDLRGTGATVEDTAASTEVAQETLQKRMGIKPDAVEIRDPVNRIVLEQGAQRVDCERIESLELGEEGDISIQRVQRPAFVFARMDQDGHSAAERMVAEPFGWILEESAAHKRERPDESDPPRVW